MKQTNKTTNKTSFHGHEFSATLNQLEKIMGQPIYEDNTGKDKVNFEWEMETESGEVFTVYDWKEYKPIQKNDVIFWHIGGYSPSATLQALNEIEKALSIGK